MALAKDQAPVDNARVLAAARYVEQAARLLFESRHTRATIGLKLSSLLTLFSLVADLQQESDNEVFCSTVLNSIGILFDVNTALLSRGLMRLEETVRPAIFSGILSDAASASVARHSRVLTENRFHNGHPDLIPHGRYVNDAVNAGEDGVEIKATKGGGAVDTHGARDAWLCVFRYHVDTTTEPIVDRAPTRIVEVLLARLTTADFRRNPRGELGTRTASPNRDGIARLRANWIYRE